MSEQTSSPPKSASTVKLALWLTFIAFLLIVMVFHSKISEIHFDSQGVSAKMANTQEMAKLSPDDRKAAEQDMAQRISALEQQGRAHADSGPQPQGQKPVPAQSPVYSDPDTPPVSEATHQQSQQYQQPVQAQPASLPNIAGTWGSPLGLIYQVSQYGNYVLISEINQGVVEAAAAGPISGWTFSLQSQNLLYHTGVLTLTVSADQRHMTGNYVDNVTGQVSGIYLNR